MTAAIIKKSVIGLAFGFAIGIALSLAVDSFAQAKPPSSGCKTNCTFTGTTTLESPLALSSTSTNTITSATSAATASSTVASFTLAPTVTLDQNDLVFNVFNTSGGTSIFKINEDGDITSVGGVAFTGSVSTTGLSLTGTPAKSITSATSAAVATSSVATITMQPSATLNADDLILAVKAVSGGSTVFSVDLEGDTTLAGDLIPSGATKTLGTAALQWQSVYVTNVLASDGLVRWQGTNGAANGAYGDDTSDGSGIGLLVGSQNALTAAGDRIVKFYQGPATGLKAEIDVLTGAYLTAAQAATVADNGNGGTAAASTTTPTSTLIRYTCNDANGCDITMAETGMQDGTVVRMTNVSANVVNFADTAGVTDIAGAFAMGQYDSLVLLYDSDRWVELSRSNN